MEIFSVYGVVRNVDIPGDRVHPEFTRGFAYVEFESPIDAEKAIKHMDGGGCLIVLLLTAVSISTTRCIGNNIYIYIQGISAVIDLLLIGMPDCDLITAIVVVY